MQTTIYYFSGTGNSLFIARELKQRLPGAELVPIVSLIGQKRIITSAPIIGLVFPVHALTIPVIVKRFIRKTDFSSAQYIFSAATRFGSVFRGFEKIDCLLCPKKKRLDASLVLNMGNNEARHESYTVPSAAHLASLEAAALQQLNEFAAIVAARKITRPRDTGVMFPVSEKPLAAYITEKLVLAGMAVSDHIGGVQYFYADGNCTGCGLCENVCLSQKITLRNHRPVWQKDVFCTMCFACLNYCPKRAIQIKSIPGVPSYTIQNGRYPHPYATAADIATQKRG